MPISATLIVSTTNVKDNTPLPNNVPDSKLENHLDYAHLKLEKVIGATLYAEIQGMIDTDSTLATEASIKLLRDYYIIPYIAWLTYYLSMPNLHSGPNVSSFTTKSPEDYEAVDSSTLKMHRQDAQLRWEEYQDRLQTFLRNSSDVKYNSYDTTTTDEERIHTTYQGGIVPRRRNTIYGNEHRRKVLGENGTWYYE